jgi:hypothetical protein
MDIRATDLPVVALGYDIWGPSVEMGKVQPQGHQARSCPRVCPGGTGISIKPFTSHLTDDAGRGLRSGIDGQGSWKDFDSRE